MRFPKMRWVMVAASVAMLGACDNQPAPKTAQEAQILTDQSSATIANFKKTDPSLQRFFDTAYGYAVFPAVRAAAVGVGGAYGQGEVYERGRMVGHADLSQANVGVSLGGQRYAEVVFFENEGSLATFKTNQVEFDARASAIAAAKGAGTSANYQKGVVVFTLPEGGLMFQAAIGGQKFRFTPLGAQ